MLQHRISHRNWLLTFSSLTLVLLLSVLIVRPLLKTASEQNETMVSSASSHPTANNFSSYLPYKGNYRYGINQGWYGANWSSQNTATLAMGNPALNVKGVGVKTLRVPLYDEFLTTYGLTSLVADFKYHESLGGGDFTAFVGHPHASHQLDTTFAGSPEKSKVFKNLYEPIWLDAGQTKINPKNTYARYLYDVVKTYGDYIKFWEIVNEPDFTYSSAGWLGDFDPNNSGTWFKYNPTPDELINLRAPIFYYIRMLRVSWEVIKKLQPDDYVCTGGIAYKSFLDALLRNTDNPDNGKVTAQYPLKAGAYFDVLSFHSYPMYYLKKWSGALGKKTYFRHSDAATNAYLMIKHNMDSILNNYGYDGKQYPTKQYICTETGVSRIMSGDNWGSNEGQKNFMIKAQIASQKEGIRQLYWFQLGDQANPNEQFDQMGLYHYFAGNAPYQATPTDQGIALKTTSDLLFGKVYDSKRTAALHLPAAIDGAAFKGTDGNYVYVLWAKTTTDLSEAASATYTFPSNIVSSNLIRKEWNFSETDVASTISKNKIKLSATPSFFMESPGPLNQNPVAHAGQDQVLTTPANKITLSGNAKDPDGTIASWQWTKISGPPQYNIITPNQSKTTITQLGQGTYTFRLTVTDNGGAKGIDDVTITLPIILPAKIEAENWTNMSGAQTEVTYDAGGGKNVGWMDKGDWLEYSFYVPAAGDYDLDLRVATPNNGGQIQIKKQDGTVLMTLNVPNTGGYQNFQTVSTILRLPEGKQTIRIQSSAVPIWNINWLELGQHGQTKIK
jgi:hypothetical protein